MIAYDLEGNDPDRTGPPAAAPMVITLGPARDLWYADPIGNEIVRVDP